MKSIRVLFFAALALMLCGCGAKSTENTVEEKTANVLETKTQIQEAEENIFAMDTYMNLKAYGENAEVAVEAAVAEIKRLDELLSIGNESSQVCQINASRESTLGEEVNLLVNRGLEIYTETDGAFDITIYPLMELWGFTTREYKVPSQEEINSVLNQVGSHRIVYDEEDKTLTLPDDMAIDFGGIAKGYTSAKIMELFREYSVTSAMVSLGGNVHVLGSKTDGTPWRVAIQNPDGSDNYLGVLSVEDKAVITSGGYERYFEENGEIYHHIMDTDTGKPADSEFLSVTIVSDDGALADALSTALFVMGKEKALEYWKAHTEEFDAILVSEEGTIYVTKGISEQFTSDYKTEVVE